MAYESKTILENFITTNHRKRDKSKYDRKLTELDVVTTRIQYRVNGALIIDQCFLDSYLWIRHYYYIEDPELLGKSPNPLVEILNPLIRIRNLQVRIWNPLVETLNLLIRIRNLQVRIRNPIVRLSNPLIGIRNQPIKIQNPPVGIRNPITAPFVITRPRQIWRQSETCVLAAVNHRQ